ncbi:GIY-YIG nuclease family protein [Actinoplanes sp. NPDC051411]|uniref:GIY-YIG nuclease family protein n=1 Tax=Actinoplanes sp. NPDC051411 TaxID=3155522 RepID=UPI003433497E
MKPPPEISRLPREPGVYRFRDASSHVLYIGRATDLRARTASYFGNLGNRPHLIRMVNRIARVEAVACASVHEAAWLERNLLEDRMPRWNRTPGGQEVPLYLRLDSGPATPGLHLTHRPNRATHGPFLGGLRTRLAVRALQKIKPLPYAGETLTGAEREMAALYGVRPEDRERLAQALTEVLDRRPQAVREVLEALTARRDEASAALDFERAAERQEEIEAVEWLTSVQRACSPAAEDCEIHGWAGGVLVSFTVRGGRLSGWRQRRCASPPRLPPTPQIWQPFAQRNAELAAGLQVTDRS